MAAVTIFSDFEAPQNKVSHCFSCFPIYLPWSDRTGNHDLSFLSVEFQDSFFTLLFYPHQEALKNYHVEADKQMTENCSNSVFIWYYCDDRSSSEEWYITVLCHLLMYFYMVVFKLLNFSFISWVIIAHVEQWVRHHYKLLLLNRNILKGSFERCKTSRVLLE